MNRCLSKQGPVEIAFVLQEGLGANLTLLNLSSIGLFFEGTYNRMYANVLRIAMSKSRIISFSNSSYLHIPLNIFRHRAGAVELANAFCRNSCPELKHLLLGGNNMSIEGGSLICKSLLHTPKLRQLGLSHTHLRSEGLMALATVLERGGLKSLEILQLAGNGIGDGGWLELAKGLGERIRCKAEIVMLGIGCMCVVCP